jgi:LPXTG-site transpeptidase (sortase) family protein
MLKGKVCILLLEICGFLCALKGIFYYQIRIEEEKNIEKFFQEKKEYGIDDVSLNYDYKEENENYLGILEIPKISLKKGFYNKTSKKNSVEYGLELIKSSKMPDEKGNLILAAHSGTSQLSYFKNINELTYDDEVYIYYKNIKYIYRISDIYEEKKNGKIELPKVENSSLITLTTCKGNNQLIIIGTLVEAKD